MLLVGWAAFLIPNSSFLIRATSSALHGAVHLNAEVMMLRWFVFTAFLLASAIPAGAQFVAPGGSIPVVASLPGANDTFWRSDVHILNLNPSATSVVLVLFPEIK